jgi:uncharacterized membrane protein
VGRLIERDEAEFGRTLSFFDATFALAMTLLVTTLEPSEYDWSSFGALWDSMGTELVSFAVSFVLVASFWWANHRFVGSLERLGSKVILANVAMLAFVVLIPFTTDALGVESGADQEVTTVVYAVNMAIVSAAAIGLHVLAVSEDLFRDRPTPFEVRTTVVDLAVTPFVFLVSIPVAVLVSGDAGRWCWFSLAVLGPISARWSAARRARESAGAAAV